jgi:hypothetical protein
MGVLIILTVGRRAFNLAIRFRRVVLNRVRDLLVEANLCNFAGVGTGEQSRKCVVGIYTNEKTRLRILSEKV